MIATVKATDFDRVEVSMSRREYAAMRKLVDAARAAGVLGEEEKETADDFHDLPQHYALVNHAANMCCQAMGYPHIEALDRAVQTGQATPEQVAVYKELTAALKAVGRWVDCPIWLE